MVTRDAFTDTVSHHYAATVCCIVTISLCGLDQFSKL